MIDSQLNSKWLKAAVIGSYWGTLEIVLGSFFHNLRFPMSGTILSFFAVTLMVSFSRIWRENGLYWRASMIAALMKSISPSAVILGPMTGIMLEGLLMELFIFIFGKNLLGYVTGGAMAVFSALLHKLITLLVLYGYNLVRLLVFLYKYALEKMNIRESQLNPWVLTGLFISLYLVTGTLAAIIGYYIGNRSRRFPEDKTVVLKDTVPAGFSFSGGYSVIWLFVHLGLLSFLLWAIGHTSPYLSVSMVVLYVTACILRYKQSVRHLKKPLFWAQLLVITLLASLVWNGVETGSLFNRAGLLAGLQMSMRAVMVMVSFSAISVELRNPLVRVILFKRGFAELYLSLSLAFSSMPVLMEVFSRPHEIVRKPVSIITRTLSLAGGLLRAFTAVLESRPPVYLVTGPVGAGKTTFLKDLVSELKKKGIKTAGLLAEGVIEDGEKKGYRLVSVSDDEKKPFGYVKAKRGKVSTGKFTFSPDAVRWGEDVLWKGVVNGKDVLIIDEVGSLELKGQGWARAIEGILKESPMPQVWAVRYRLVDAVQTAWSFRAEEIVDINTQTPARLADNIGKILEKRVS